MMASRSFLEKISGHSFQPPSKVQQTRLLRFEPLESREMLSITVNTLVDENDGIGVGGISLRDAIAAATPGETIDFSVTGTINLTQGELLINKNLTIAGPGANLLTVDASGNDPTPTTNNGDGSRVFLINDGQSQVRKVVAISGITITGGDVNDDGGGISTHETLSITNSVVSDNNARLSSGGGIFASNTSYGLTVTNCTISGNMARSRGGGIYYSATGNPDAPGRVGLTITQTSIEGNQTTTNNGGGIFVTGAIVRISESTLSGNIAAGSGGGLHISGSVTSATVIQNSTISGNNAGTSGGGVAQASSLSLAGIVLRNVTITDNRSPMSGGGINMQNDGTVRIINSIVSANLSQDSVTPNNIQGTLHPESSYNLVGTNGNGGLLAFRGNILDIDDPLLGPLQNNGGPTATHVPNEQSLAIDAGNPSQWYESMQFDQRGVAHARVLNGRVDIGAVETPGPAIEPPPIVDLALFVPNLDFEEYHSVPTGPSQMLSETLVAWQNFSGGTPDYLHVDGYMGAVGGFETGIATPPPDGSKGFIGVISTQPPSYFLESHEYALSVLPEPLAPGQRYQFDLFAGTTSTGGNFGGAFYGELVLYGIIDKSLVPVGGASRIEAFASQATNYVELLAVPVDLPPSSWTSFHNQIFMPSIPIEAIVFGARTVGGSNGQAGIVGQYLLIDASASTPQSELLGDYNLNGIVDAPDYVVWRRTLGTNVTMFSGADGNGDGMIDNLDYNVWRSHFGETLSPGSGAIATNDVVALSPNSENLRIETDNQPTTTHIGVEGPIANLGTAFSPAERPAKPTSSATILAEPRDLIALLLEHDNGIAKSEDELFKASISEESQEVGLPTSIQFESITDRLIADWWRPALAHA